MKTPRNKTKRAVRRNEISMKDIRIDAMKRNFKTPQILYALIFRHSEGWTFLEFFKTVREAQMYKLYIDLPRGGFQFKIIPYKLTPKIKDLTL